METITNEQPIARSSILLQAINGEGANNIPSWIMDWDNNKTQIGSKWVISPNIFSGIKNADGTLTGVMLTRITDHPGIYGYDSGKDVFHINDTEALISGWKMKESGIQNADGTLKILSEGTIISGDDTDSTVTHWSLKADGSAIFANGNVTMNPDGSASFEGTIKAKDGKIGGWNIAETRFYSTGMCLDTKTHSFAVEPSGKVSDSENYMELVKQNGGVAMYYTKSSDYGLVGYARFSDSCEQTFSIGATNHIAGWSFDNDSIYMSEKCNTASLFSTTNSITIGSNGIRGKLFRFEIDGSGAIANGAVKWDSTGAVVFSDEASIAFVDSITGTYLSKIDKNGVYTGELSADNITSGTISTATIRQKNGMWELNADGSGVLANEGIVWDNKGNIVMKSGTIGGMKIVNVGITNEGFNNDAYIVLRNDNNNCFAGIGGNVLPASTGACAVARFENHYDGGYAQETWFQQAAGSNYALIVSAKRARRNIAISIGAGYISGMALNTEIIETSQTLKRGINVAVTLSNTEVLTITLPTMRQCDDGYVLVICNQGSYGGTLHAGKNYENDEAEKSGTTRDSILSTPDGNLKYMYIVRGVTRIRLVYCHYIKYTISEKIYNGCWMVL